MNKTDSEEEDSSNSSEIGSDDSIRLYNKCPNDAISKNSANFGLSMYDRVKRRSLDTKPNEQQRKEAALKKLREKNEFKKVFYIFNNWEKHKTYYRRGSLIVFN